MKRSLTLLLALPCSSWSLDAAADVAGDPSVATHPPLSSTADPTARVPRLVQRTRLTLCVPNREAAVDQIVTIATQGGASPPERHDQRVILRVPVARASEVLDRLQQLGDRRALASEAIDVSAPLADLEAELSVLRAARARLLALRPSGAPVADQLRIERQVAEVDGRIAKCSLRLAQYARDTAQVEVVVVLEIESSPPPEPIPVPRLPFPWLRRLGLGSLEQPQPSSRERPRAVLDAMLDLGLYMEGSRANDLPHPDDQSYSVLGALRIRGKAPGRPVSLALGLDAAFGGGTGFADELDALLGLGSGIGRRVSFGLLSGLAGRSWTGGRVPAAWEIPAELFVATDLGDWGRILLQARPQWILPASKRASSPRSIVGDELLLRGTVAIAPLAGARHLEDGSLRLGLAVHEIQATQLWTVIVGWGAGFTDVHYR